MSELVHFHQHLRTVCLVGRPAAPSAQPSEETSKLNADLEALQKKAYEKGAQAARQELKAEIDAAQALQGKLFKRLQAAEQELTEVIEAALPDLIVEGVRQVIPKWVPTGEDVQHVIQEMLSGLEGESGMLEIRLNDADKAQLDTLRDGSWEDLNGTKLIVDKSLKPGECMVSGRFGRIDGRFESKLNHLRKNISE